jgi:hypothetical protein
MDDVILAARSELAFLKALADDRGALPPVLGWHLVAIGAVFGLDFVHIWAVHAGLAPWPTAWRWLVWVPGVIVYLPFNLVINARGRHDIAGPTGRAFGAAWATIAIIVPACLLVLTIAQARSGHPFYLVWPSFSFVLYGGTWILAALVSRRAAYGAVALGCLAAALASAALIGSAAQWLVLAAAFALVIALPGAAIVRHARRAG